MIYFDNAATSFPKAPGVNEAMFSFLADAAANPGRAGHRMAVTAEKMLDDARLKLTRFFNAPDPERMVFALNCTDALNMAIKGVVGCSGKAPEHVITTILEHNSVSRPLQALADAGTIELTRVESDVAGLVDPADIAAAIRPNTSLIVMTHASNVLGTLQDVAAIGHIAREHDLLFCLDAAQTAGVVDVDFQAMNIDLLAFPGHKSLLGPTGTAGLYVGERCPQPADPATASPTAANLHPWREGGTGGDSSTPTQPGLFPYYLEGGTPNTVGIAGLSAAMSYLDKNNPADAIAHERAIIQRVIDQFQGNPRVTIYGPNDAQHRVGALSINIEGFEADQAGAILDDTFNIAVRPGLHCAPYIHRKLNTSPAGTIRISPGPFTSEQDTEALVNALKELTC